MPGVETRPLGGTGVQVSPLCLGAMMFGGWGNPDHDESIRIIHRALDAGINFIDTADVYSRGESEEIVGKALGPPRPGRPRHQVPRLDGGRSERARQLAPLDHRGGGQQPAPPRHRLDRPLPGAPLGPLDRSRRDARRPDRPRAGRQGALHRQLDLPALGDRGGPVGGGAPRPRALRLRAAAVLDARPRRRGRGAPDLPAVRHGRDPLGPAGGRLAVRPLPGRPGAAAEHARLAHPAALRHVAARQPAQARGRRRARTARRARPG